MIIQECRSCKHKLEEICEAIGDDDYLGERFWDEILGNEHCVVSGDCSTEDKVEAGIWYGTQYNEKDGKKFYKAILRPGNTYVYILAKNVDRAVMILDEAFQRAVKEQNNEKA